ncbi:MAG: glycoside hydrolase family 99-like domain-containing protein [Saccharofermentanales bacterium]
MKDNFGRKIDVGYLLREGFAGAPRGKSSGWEYYNLVSQEHAPAGLIFDDKENQRTALFKRFLKQDKEKFTADILFTIRGNNKDSQIAVKSGDTDVVLITISDDTLFYINNDGSESLIKEIPAKTMTGLRIDIDLKDGLADIWIDGKITLKKQPLTGGNGIADRIYFGSTDDGFADYVVNAIEIYKGFSLYENLFISTTNDLPDNWKTVCTGDSDCGCYSYGKMAFGMEFNVFKMTNNMSMPACKLASDYEIAGSGVYEYDFFLDEVADGFAVSFSGTSGEMVFFTRSGDLYFKNSDMDKEVIVIPVVKPRIWYRIQLLLDCENKSLTVNTNGFEAFNAGISGRISDGAFSGIEITAAQSASGSAMVDRICIKPMVARRKVPKPEIVDTGDITVNMQVCNLWREGTHAGWRVYTEKWLNRKPLLGWYDESDPEVADWELKWALEHGISSFMYCWYRPNIGQVPVKQGYLDEQLWSGYFNSAFKKDFKFTIMFTNHNVFNIESCDDMIENVMPYMIEVFFRNPNYLKTSDNKPILYIYDMRELLLKLGDPNVEGSVGTPEDVKAMFEKMREMTKKAGFGGLLILGEYRGKDPDYIKKIAQSEYDYAFAYTWHPEYKNITHDNMLLQIQDYLTTQRKLLDEYGGKTKVIPNVSVAWDPSAWNHDVDRDEGTTFTFDLAHLEELLKWVRDEYGTPVLDDKGMKMIMIDNWNEYGEGHYFMPAYGTPAYRDPNDPAALEGKQGFGWLDCIRKIYGKNDFKHTDVWPLEEGFGPYDKWFPKAWSETDVPDLEGQPINDRQV